MKRFIILLALLSFKFSYSQLPCDDYCIDFDDTLCLSNLTVDTIAYPENIWQIGIPQKPEFDEILSEYHPKAIITDTLNSYPTNNNSAFIIWVPVSMGDYYGLTIFSCYYNVQTDSLNDYGIIEFSPDNGATWINLVNDTVYSSSIHWWSQKPILTGNSDGWRYFEAMLADLGSIFNIQIGDTLLYRFTFQSDSIAENLGGIMYDDICFWEFIEGVTETRFKPLKSNIYPNPSNDIFTIEFENPDFGVFQLAVYNDQSKLVFSNEYVADNETIINSKQLAPGIYFYKLTNPKTLQRSWGKFIVIK
ncbi:T9SS type A sorting domain-containing protein [Bacteroidota bacterium]